MATCDQLSTWLSEAETARHALMLGDKPLITMYGNKSVQFKQIDAATLESYISRLKQWMARQRCPGCSKARGPLTVVPIDANSGC